ncbi:MAG: NupC/NupG family nucleoside CNT transporter [Sarcina sp.]
MDRFTGVLGIIAIIGLAFLFSENKKKINWRLVITGLVLQILFALFVLKTSIGQDIFNGFNGVIMKLLSFASEGTNFLFGPLSDGSGAIPAGSVFVFNVLPTMIFFSSLMSILYHLGVMQILIKVVSKGLAKILGTSGAETLSAVGNIFLGQTEAPLLVKPYIGKMTRSELLAIMVGGMATVAGGVMAGYVAMGINAGDLLAGSIMAAPAGLLLAKILIPETEVPETQSGTEVKLESTSSSVIEAAANGASEGLGMALNVAAMLLAFIALIALINALLGWFGGLFGMDYLSLYWILGKVFAPVAWLMGVPAQDITTAGSLLGQKIAINEFVAYSELGINIANHTLQPKTIMILSYALCGFANFTSIAIQIAGIGGLAPERKGTIAKLGFKALLGGALATFMTATIAGILFSV